MHAGHSPLLDLETVMTTEELLALQEAAINIYVAAPLYDYVAKLAQETRRHKQVQLGVSPRGALMLVQAAKGRALLEGRDYVLPDDIHYLAPYCLAHRLILHSESELAGASVVQVIEQILQNTPLPKQA